MGRTERMAGMKRYTRPIIAVLLFVAGIVVSVYVRFTNIDMSETRLFVEYWKVWVVVIIGFVTGRWLMLGWRE